MITSRLLAATCIFAWSMSSASLKADQKPLATGTWPLERLKAEVPKYRITDDSGPIHSILYEGEPISGRKTEVFAFYASPQTLALPNAPAQSPAIVLIHGGGGTAFSDWVWMWARRGYAAIAMDLSGRQPPPPRYAADGKKITDYGHRREQRKRLNNAGLDHTRIEKFDSIGGSPDDDWPYHAVASVIRAHSLIRSFEEVDPNRTAVTGISWGGYTTCLVASLDNRFKAAVPVYGCGFLHEGESVQKPAIDALGDRRKAWVQAYDPGSHLAKCSTPIMWVNGTHDVHYVLDSYARSYALPTGPTTFRIEHKMGHSHPAGWKPKEIEIYINSILKSGVPLPKLGSLKTTAAGTVTASIQSQTSITAATLHYTSDQGVRSKRTWQSLPVTIGSDQLKVIGLPPQANTWMVTVTDERGAMVSTEVCFR